MGARNTTKRDVAEQLARVKRHIDQTVFELAEARARMTGNPRIGDQLSPGNAGESELATLCISLELSLADSVVWAQRLAEKVRQACEPADAVAVKV